MISYINKVTFNCLILRLHQKKFLYDLALEKVQIPHKRTVLASSEWLSTLTTNDIAICKFTVFQVHMKSQKI